MGIVSVVAATFQSARKKATRRFPNMVVKKVNLVSHGKHVNIYRVTLAKRKRKRRRSR